LTTAFEVPANPHIEALAKRLAEEFDTVSPPAWAAYVKTGVHAERPPDRKDWWYIRCASLLRKLYFSSPMGVASLRSEYGGRKAVGGRPKHFAPGSGSIIRNALQQLEAAGLVKTVPKKGRVLTDRGRSLLDKVAAEVKPTLTNNSSPQV